MWSPAKSPRVPRLSRVLRYDFGLSRLRWNQCPACLGITVQLRLESLSSLYRDSQLDVTMREDASTIRKDNAPENLSLLKKIVLNILRTDTSGRKKTSLRLRRKRAAWNDDLRAQLLGLNPL